MPAAETSGEVRAEASGPAPLAHPSLRAAFVYLTVHSARNRLTRQLRRMRSPRYLLAILFAAGYFWLMFSRQGQDADLTLSVAGNQTAALITATSFTLLAGYWWLVGGDRGALAFSPAEVQFLFTAPVTRRELIQFKLLRAQLLILANIVLWTLLLGRGRGPEEMVWLRPLSLWVMFSTLQLHRLGATLTLESAAEHGRAGWWRRLLPLVVVLAVAGALVMGIANAWPTTGVRTPGDLIAALGAGLRAPPAAHALAPVRLVSAPLFASSPAAWLHAIWPAALLMLAHVAWVLRSDHAFEESAVAASQQRAKRIAARRTGTVAARGDEASARRWRVPLRPTGEPAVAFLWKNAIAAARGDRFLRQAVLFTTFMAALAVGAWMIPGQLAEFAAGLLAAWGGLLVIGGPLWVRFDLRRDLTKLELLRTYPVDANRLVAAQIASSALLLTILQFALLVTAFVALLGNPDVTLGRTDRLALFTAAALGLPALNGLSASIHNAAALLFPAWVNLGSERPAGVEAMGQIYLTMFASFLVLLVLLLLPALAGAGLVLALAPSLGMWSGVPAVVAGSVAALVELMLMVRWLGRVFDRTEPSAVGVTT